jgi:multidrug efflux pump subunit AcrA (membrane-fusion protein)
VSDENDEKVAAAMAEAKRARIMSWIWWAQVPIVCLTYWFISKEPSVEKMILVYLAAVSIVANAVTYSGKSEAAEAKAAGYENP